MTTLSPTSLAVSAAVADHREAAGLTVDELAETVRHLSHRMTPAEIRAIEAGEAPATVDDLVALAVAALGTTPVVLLSHVPADFPDPDEGPIATGVPTTSSALNCGTGWKAGPLSTGNPVWPTGVSGPAGSSCCAPTTMSSSRPLPPNWPISVSLPSKRQTPGPSSPYMSVSMKAIGF